MSERAGVPSKVLRNIEIQSNGIIRNAKGYLIGRITDDLGFMSPHIQDGDAALSLRGKDWKEFSEQVFSHIENYTVPQYGDKGEDQASEFTAHDHIVQAKKYLNRFGRNSRPGQEVLDLVKGAHYLQMAMMELEKELAAKDNDYCPYREADLGREKMA